MFDNYKTAKCLRADAAKVVIARADFENNNISKKNRRVHAAVRFTSCAAVAAALVLTGAVWIPKAQKADNSDSFEIVAYAANGKGNAVTLGAKLSPLFYYGRISDYPAQKAPFECKGKNLCRVTYSARTGFISYQSRKYNEHSEPLPYALFSVARNDYIFKAGSASLKKATVCSFEIPQKMLGNIGKYYENGVCKSIDEFTKQWHSARFDKYCKSRPKNLIFTSRYTYMITRGWNPINPQERVKSGKCVITIVDTLNKNFVFIVDPFCIFAKSFTVKQNDNTRWLQWSQNMQSFIFNNGKVVKKSIYKLYCEAKKSDTNKILDKITVTGTFKDGKSETKQIEIYFNGHGVCCMKLVK